MPFGGSNGGRKLGGAQRFRLQLMPQLQAQIPDPLRNDLPGFLTAGRMRTPPIWILFFVFIREGGFKGTTMQIECYDIRCRQGILRQLRA